MFQIKHLNLKLHRNLQQPSFLQEQDFSFRSFTFTSLVEHRDLSGENTEEESKDSLLSPVLIYILDQKSPQIALMVVGVQSGNMGSCMPCLHAEKVTYFMVWHRFWHLLASDFCSQGLYITFFCFLSEIIPLDRGGKAFYLHGLFQKML